jgi:hypothetical protein
MSDTPTPTDELTDEQLADYAAHVEAVPDGRGDENPDAPTDEESEVPA